MNSFGTIFRVTLWGESHGPAIGVSLDGVPAGMPLSEEDFAADLARRRAGAAGTTARHESDSPHIVSGLFRGRTTGAPLTVEFRNGDARPADYPDLRLRPRPSHADFAAAAKYGGCNDFRGGGHFSGRMTLGIVAAGVVAKRILGGGVSFSTSVAEIGGESDSSRFDAVIAAAVRDGDSVGGVIECRAEGGPSELLGLGEPFFDSVESVAAHLLFSVPAVKGVEFGSGFAGARRRGSENNDPIIDRTGLTAANNAGGVNGGIANGNPITLRAAIKPAPTISRVQETFDFEVGEIRPLAVRGRHDACIALRAGVVVEAALAVALADLKLRRR